MMMMNFSMIGRTTFALVLSALLVASIAVVTSSKTKNVMATDDKKVYEADGRFCGVLADGSSDCSDLVFSRTYIAVTKAADFATRLPNGGDFETLLKSFQDQNNPPSAQFQIQGSSTTQKGGVFGPDSIEIANRPEGVTRKGPAFTSGNFQTIKQLFAGNRQLRFEPVENPFYFFHGQCIATSGIFEPFVQVNDRAFGSKIEIPQPIITSHLCRLNLCLGGGGFNCIAIYSGTAFVFNLGKGILQSSEGISMIDVDGAFKTFEPPPLPPPFPGTIIGGTGAFEGIEGSVDIATIAGTTGPLVFNDVGSSDFPVLPPIGSIVQVISVKSNMPLPPGP